MEVPEGESKPAKLVTPEFQANSVDFHMQTPCTLVMCPISFRSNLFPTLPCCSSCIFCIFQRINFGLKLVYFTNDLLSHQKLLKKIPNSHSCSDTIYKQQRFHLVIIMFRKHTSTETSQKRRNPYIAITIMLLIADQVTSCLMELLSRASISQILVQLVCRYESFH